MIVLPHKGICKRKQFDRALIVGNFIYLEFMNHKNSSPFYCRGNDYYHRDMTPRPKILKVIEKNRLQLIYFYNDEKWNNPKDKCDNDYSKETGFWMLTVATPIYSAHNLWSWYQKDEVRNVKSMTKEELLTEYLTELI